MHTEVNQQQAREDQKEEREVLKRRKTKKVKIIQTRRNLVRDEEGTHHEQGKREDGRRSLERMRKMKMRSNQSIVTFLRTLRSEKEYQMSRILSKCLRLKTPTKKGMLCFRCNMGKLTYNNSNNSIQISNNSNVKTK